MIQSGKLPDKYIVDPIDVTFCEISTLHKLLTSPLNKVFPKKNFPAGNLTGSEKLIDLLSDAAISELLRYLPQSAAEYQEALGKGVMPEDPYKQKRITELLNSIKVRNHVDVGVIQDAPSEAAAWWGDVSGIVKMLPFESIKLIADENILMMTPFRRQLMLSASRYAKDGKLELTDPYHVLNKNAYRLLSDSSNPFLNSYQKVAKKMMDGQDEPAVSFLMNRFNLSPMAARQYLINLIDPSKNENAAVELLAFFSPSELDKLAEEFRLTKLMPEKYSYAHHRV